MTPTTTAGIRLVTRRRPPLPPTPDEPTPRRRPHSSGTYYEGVRRPFPLA